MALVFADRVLETSTTTGTGAYALGGSVTGFRAFSAALSVGDTCYYSAYEVDSNGNPSGGEEIGLGTYSAANTLTRTTVLVSSNANAAVSWATGTRRIMLTPVAAGPPFSWVDSSGNPRLSGTEFNYYPSTYRLRVLDDATYVYLQAGTVSPSAANGNLFISGIFGYDLSSFRIAATTHNFNVGGTTILALGSTGATVTGNLTVTGSMSASNPQFTGVSYYQQSNPTALTATGTLTIAQLLTLIITVTSTTAVTLTLPTGTLTDAGILSGALAVNEAFEWYIINLGSSSGAVTLAAGTGHTIVGSATVAIGTSARFLTRKTATNTFVTYRIA